MKKKILVKGPALTSSGYGEHARLILRALRQQQEYFDIFFENITWGNTGFLIEDDEERDWIDSLCAKTVPYKKSGGQFDISVQITIPPEWSKIAPVNIGVTAGIETTKIAPQWIEKCHLMDKIIVPSQHARYAFDNTSYMLKNNQTGDEVEFKNNTPIEVVHYPVKSTSPSNIDLGLDCEFNFLCVAQWGPRKNLANTIKWFVEEFKSEEVGLLVKTNKRKNNIADRMHCKEILSGLLSSYPDRKCKVYLVHGNMTEGEMVSLYSHPQIHALATATHGEGFGLPIFEAAYSGLPIIAPNWGGHLDFLYAPKKDKKGKLKSRAHFTKVDYDVAPIQAEAHWEGVLQKDSQWCFPKQHSFRSSLREVYKNYGTHKSIAKRLAQHVKDNFTEERSYGKIIEILGGKQIEEFKREVDKLLEGLL